MRVRETTCTSKPKMVGYTDMCAVDKVESHSTGLPDFIKSLFCSLLLLDKAVFRFKA